MKGGFLHTPTDVPNTLVLLGWGGNSSDNSSHLPLCPYQTYAKGRIATHATERTQKTVDSVHQPQEHMLPLLPSLPRYSPSWAISELHYKWKINKYGGKCKWESFTSGEKTISCPTSPITRALVFTTYRPDHCNTEVISPHSRGSNNFLKTWHHSATHHDADSGL